MPQAELILGKLSVRSSEGNHSANFRWQNSATGYDVVVWGPLGQGRTRLVGTASSMTVSRGRDVLAQGHPEDVMHQSLGWSLPVAVFASWLAGQPAVPERVSDPTREGDRWLEFTEAEWRVVLSRHAVDGDGLPRRIKAIKDDLSVLLVVRERVAAESLTH